MIKKTKQISISEAREYVEENKDIQEFMKNFSLLSPEDAKSLREKLHGLELMKLNDKSISEIIDLLPKDSVDLNKIFSDLSLDEDESKKVLDTIKEFE